MTLGNAIVEMLRAKMLENNLTSLGQINGKIMAEWVDERFADWKPKKARVLPKPRQTDDAYLAELQGEPSCEGINVRAEFAKLSLWCKTNGKAPTRRRFTQWLLKCQPDREMVRKAAEQPALPHLEAPPNWVEWVEREMPTAMYRGQPWAKWPPYAKTLIVDGMLAEQLRERNSA